jgi:hypothetical protein
MAASHTRQGRRAYSTQLGSLIPGIGDKSFRRRGFVHGQIVTQWHQVVGPSLASVSAPEGLRFPPGKKRGATLTIRAASGAGLELQHHMNMILERVNMFFGYTAVEKISIRQGPLPQPAQNQPTRPSQRSLSKREQASVASTVKTVKDQTLKEALERLGGTIISQS